MEEAERAGAITTAERHFLELYGGPNGTIRNQDWGEMTGSIGPTEATFDRTTGRWIVTKVIWDRSPAFPKGPLLPVRIWREWKWVVYHAPDGWRIEFDKSGDRVLADKEAQDEESRARLRAKAWAERAKPSR
jgi:hypothetical protein